MATTDESFAERQREATRQARQLKLDHQCEVIRALNTAESLLTGWVLRHDPEVIEGLMSPLYALCDKG